MFAHKFLVTARIKMPGRRCAVADCRNSRAYTKQIDQGIVYHNFPKGRDFVSNTVRIEWIRRCKRSDTWNPNTSQICSVHFRDDNYERDMRNELLGLPLRKLLKRNAVPTLNLHCNPKGALCSLQTEVLLAEVSSTNTSIATK